MPRLDVWLVENGLFTSRQTAKRAIKNGHITVNDRVAKPSTWIKGDEDIRVTSSNLDTPLGYTKLKQLNSRFNNQLIEAGKYALDIGSSAGGFLIYLLEKGSKAVTGIEVSEEFIDQLVQLAEKYKQLSIIIGDAFQIDPSDIGEIGSFDLLLIDVTTDSSGTTTLIERYSPILKSGGYLVAAIKSKYSISLLNELTDTITHFGYTKIQYTILDESHQEVHLVARRK